MPEKPKLFISWSGPRSEAVAKALADWIPMVVQSIGTPFLSSAIEGGDHWQKKILEGLDQSDEGIAVITPENQLRPWLNFEAGAIGVRVGSMTPYLVGLRPSDLKLPLAVFQSVPATKDATFKLMSEMSTRHGSPLKEEALHRLLESTWPQFETELNNALEIQIPDALAPERSSDDMLREVLVEVRKLARSADSREARWYTLPEGSVVDLGKIKSGIISYPSISAPGSTRAAITVGGPTVTPVVEGLPAVPNLSTDDDGSSS